MVTTDGTLEKLLTIEKAVNEMVTLRQGILELKESEANRQKDLDQLRANENRHRVLLEHLPQQIFMRDKDSVYILCNQRYAAALRRKPGEIIGKTDKELYPREVAERYCLEDQRILTTGQAEDTEECLFEEGKSLLVHKIKTPLRDGKGEIIGILGVTWDITEQRNKENDLRRNYERLEASVADLTAELQWKNKLLEGEMAERKRLEDRLQGTEGYRRIFEKMRTPVVLIEENGVVSMANAEFEELSGYSKEEVEGKKFLMEFLGREGTERMSEYLSGRAPKPNELMHDAEFQLFAKNGEIRNVSLKLSAIPERKGSLVTLMDISETKRAKERIEELEEIYISLVQNVSEGIALVKGGVLNFANPNLFEILGYSKEELTSKPFKEFILPEDRECFENQPSHPMNGEVDHTSSFRIIHKDGSVRWLENREALIHHGKDKAVLHLLTDKTHQKQVEDELRRSIEPFRRLVDTIEKYCWLERK